MLTCLRGRQRQQPVGVGGEGVDAQAGNGQAEARTQRAAYRWGGYETEARCPVCSQLMMEPLCGARPFSTAQKSKIQPQQSKAGWQE